MKNIIYIIFPFITIFEKLIINLKPYFCKHQMRYWDMKLVLDNENPFYGKLNGLILEDSFCECQKCGVKYKKSYIPKHQKWGRSNFDTNKTNIIEVEIFQSETKKQKRDRLLSELLN